MIKSIIVALILCVIEILVIVIASPMAKSSLVLRFLPEDVRLAAKDHADPPKHKQVIAFTLVGCPLWEYARKYGYEDLMPHMCALDHAYAKLMHAKLIRTHTVATGADSCDYWYVPDKSRFAKKYKGKIV